MTKLHSLLLRDQRGTSVVELALIAPILAALVLGTVDLSAAYSAKLQLEQAAQRTIEKVQAEGYEDDSDHKAAIKTEAATAAGVAESAVTVESWLQCNNATTKLAYSGSCANASDPYARYVQVTIQKQYTTLFRSKYAGVNGVITLTGQAGVRVQ
jgi:Flp pilus assembly protein TadG